MAILYKVAPLSYSIGKFLIKITSFGLPNIVAGRKIVREFIQEAAEPASMCDEMLRLLDDQDYRKKMEQDLKEVRQLLGDPGCSVRVSDMIAEMLSA